MVHMHIHLPADVLIGWYTVYCFISKMAASIQWLIGLLTLINFPNFNRGFPKDWFAPGPESRPENLLAIQIINWPDKFSIVMPLGIWVTLRSTGTKPRQIWDILLIMKISTAVRHICNNCWIPVKKNEIFNICKISFNKRYLLHTYILLCTIATFQKAGTCLEAQQSMAKQPIKGCVSNHSRTCGESVCEKSE